jgi:hypothetical protein
VASVVVGSVGTGNLTVAALLSWESCRPPGQAACPAGCSAALCPGFMEHREDKCAMEPSGGDRRSLVENSGRGGTLRHALLLSTTLGLALVGGAAFIGTAVAEPSAALLLAQASGASPNAPGTQPLPGGGVAAGPGAPASASPGAGPVGRGAPPPGSATAPGLGDATGGSNVTPGGAIRPGAAGSRGNPTGGSSSHKGGG